MNTSVTHKGIEFELLMNEPPSYINNIGWVHPAKLVGSYERDQLQDLIGLQLWGSPVLAVESYAVFNQTDRPISLLLNEKKWDGRYE